MHNGEYELTTVPMGNRYHCKDCIMDIPENDTECLMGGADQRAYSPKHVPCGTGKFIFVLTHKLSGKSVDPTKVVNHARVRNT